MKRTLSRFVRPALFLLCLWTSAYALLLSHPFSAPLLETGFLPGWARLVLAAHPVLAVAILWASAAALPAKAPRRGDILFWCFGVTAAAAAGLILAHPLDSPLGSSAARALAFASWLPLLLWELIGLVRRPAPRMDQEPEPGEEERVLAASLTAAVWSWAVFALGTAASGPGPGFLFASLWSLLTHLMLFLTAFACWRTLSAAVRAAGLGRQAEHAVLLTSAAAAAAWGVERGMLGPLGLPGLGSWGLAGTAAASAALCWNGLSREEARAPASPVELLKGPLCGRRFTILGCLLALSLLGAASLFGVRFVSTLDWGHLFRCLIAVLSWPLAAAIAHGTLPPRIAPDPRMRRILALGPPAAAFAAVGAAAALGPSLAAAGAAPARVLDGRAAADPSFRAARRLFMPRRDPAGLFAFLQNQTNLPADTPLHPRWTASLPSAGEKLRDKPDVYIFVIDSLRSDFLAPYSKDVDFTPSIDAFARENLFFRRSFTAYGGTGLAQPALWAGSLLPHIQPLLPFSPFDSFEKLMRAEGYRFWVSRDVYLQKALSREPQDRDLDQGSIGDYRFCRTLEEISTRLNEPREGPIFVYTRPEDLHIAVLKRGAPVSRDYGRFYPPYADRVRRLDSCFGRFVERLKKTGRYENSIIVLTADHGDSLGEEQRWGHAYDIDPEVVRVPLIWHVPRRLLSGRMAERDAPAFTIDIFPSIAQLLGRSPPPSDGLRGRPLFPPKAAAASPRPPQLVASAYGPVYGLVSDRGRRLFVADAVGYRTACYDLGSSGGGEGRSCAAAEGSLAAARMRRALERLQRAFGYETR